MEDKNKELRYLASAEVRAVPAEDGTESRCVVGYAALYGTTSEDIGFREVLAPGAFDGVIEVSDVLCLLNHQSSRGVLARSRQGEGSLTLSLDEKGLKYSFDAPNTALGDELLEGIKRGDITQSSFSFSVQKDSWEELEDGTYMRTIVKVRALYDVSPVYYPAYTDTSVAIRSLDAIKAEKNTPPAQDGITYNSLSL